MLSIVNIYWLTESSSIIPRLSYHNIEYSTAKVKHRNSWHPQKTTHTSSTPTRSGVSIYEYIGFARPYIANSVLKYIFLVYSKCHIVIFDVDSEGIPTYTFENHSFHGAGVILGFQILDVDFFITRMWYGYFSGCDYVPLLLIFVRKYRRGGCVRTESFHVMCHHH